MKNKSGYTLIEVVTVAGIMALFGITLIAVFLSTMRGGIKTEIIQLVHRNGDFALKAMSGIIRNAKEVDCSGIFEVAGFDGNTSDFQMQLDNGINRIASISSVNTVFLTSNQLSVSNLSFSCKNSYLNNQVVTIRFNLESVKGQASGAQVQEKVSQEFATSVATRQY